MELQATATRLLVNCMMKLAVPRLTISFMVFISGLPEASGLRRSSAPGFRRKRMTNKADRHCEMTVATAAPATPMPSTKMKIGSRTMLATVPIRMVIMPTPGKPWALM